MMSSVRGTPGWEASLTALTVSFVKGKSSTRCTFSYMETVETNC